MAPLIAVAPRWAAETEAKEPLNWACKYVHVRAAGRAHFGSRCPRTGDNVGVLDLLSARRRGGELALDLAQSSRGARHSEGPGRGGRQTRGHGADGGWRGLRAACCALRLRGSRRGGLAGQWRRGHVGVRVDVKMEVKVKMQMKLSIAAPSRQEARGAGHAQTAARELVEPRASRPLTLTLTLLTCSSCGECFEYYWSIGIIKTLRRPSAAIPGAKLA